MPTGINDGDGAVLAILSIAELASSLEERLGDDFVFEPAEHHADSIQARVEEWCKVIALGNLALLEQRLTWDGLYLKGVRPVLGRVHLRKDTALPAWTNTLSAVLHLAPSMSPPTYSSAHECVHKLRCVDPNDPLPFEELLAPFVVVGRQRLMTQTEAVYRLLSNVAHDALERDLLRQLTIAAARALHVEFSIRRFQATTPLTRLINEIRNFNGQTLYQEFVSEMLQGELLDFFQGYPVLARLLSTVTDLWAEATAEFLLRLAADWTTIADVFGGSSPLQQVVAIQSGLSDPHKGRRSVLALTFASGRKLVYKPKNMGIDMAFNKLLAWCNEQDIPLKFMVLTVINRESYGWIEFVERQRCPDSEAAQRYYQRAGMLLCLIYMLVGTDCHHENLITHNEYPILVDTETLMQHRARVERLDNSTQAQLLAHETIADSVLHTGLLPSWHVNRNRGEVYDVSGLRGPDELMYETEAPRWEHINTDRMTLKSALLKIEPPSDYLTQSGIALRVAEHEEDVLMGFEQFYRFLLLHREALLAPESPLYSFKEQPLRLLFRNTQEYGSLLHQLLDPRYLRDGVDRSIQLEALGLAQMPAPELSWEGRTKSRWWPILAQEKQAMQQMDIPFFSVRADSDGLTLASGEHIEACFREPSADLVFARLQSLCARDLEQQFGFISGSLYAYAARDPQPVAVVSQVHLPRPINSDESKQNEQLIAHSLRVAEEIDHEAIRAVNGSASWIAPQYMYWAQRYQFQPIGADLYSGACGVALFLAAIEKTFGGAGYRNLALGALDSLRETLRGYGPTLAKELGIGGATGLASVIYAMTRIGCWLGEPALMEDARRAVQLMTFEQITNDTTLDTFSGSAGAILGLLAAYEVLPEPGMLDRAMACGRRLLETRVVGPTGFRAWPGVHGRLLTGFSHGAAGVAYALLRLYAVTQESEFRAAAQEGIAYEDSVFLPEISNWPDLRSGEPLDFRVAWCHGAPGIGLARLGGLHILDTEQVRHDIERALQRTVKEGVQALDSVCCGNMGRVDILLTAAHVLADSGLAKIARQLMTQIFLCAEERGAFALDPRLPRHVHHLGFFQGKSGLGYSLLRMAFPESLPSVLLWQ